MSEPASTTGTVHQDGVGEPDELERLWTPHRLAYIKGENKPADADAEGECPFCRIPKLADEEGLVVHRGEASFVVLNLYPYSPGHLMVCPYRHVADYPELDDAETAEVAAFTKTGDADRAPGQRRARLQPRHEPGRGGRGRASPRTCTSTSCRAGAATRTSCRSSGAPAPWPSCSPTPGRCWPTPGREPRDRPARASLLSP